MSRLIFLPRKQVSGAPAAPASFVFNGTDEYLERNNSTTNPTTQTVTLSCWTKVPNISSGVGSFIAVFASPGDRECWWWGVDIGADIVGWDDPDYDEFIDYTIDDDVWHHWVLRFDTTQAAAANRVRIYRDGILILPSLGDFAPVQNTSLRWFKNGLQFWIGNSYCGGMTTGKIAFVDVVQDLSLDPTAFAFDDSGTWTRMPYSGLYGNYGFSLDGADGFNDVSGNGLNFTGLNMTVGENLDFVDLPSFIT